MKNARTSDSPASQTDRARVDAMQDADTDLSDIPEVSAAAMARGRLRVGGKPVERGKRRVTLYLDAWIIEMFKQQAGPRGYQTLINQVLAQHLLAEDLTSLVRRIVREELARQAPTQRKSAAAGPRSTGAMPRATRKEGTCQLAP
jgi:uncharacterized protein (DUF4415 family)